MIVLHVCVRLCAWTSVSRLRNNLPASEKTGTPWFSAAGPLWHEWNKRMALMQCDMGRCSFIHMGHSCQWGHIAWSPPSRFSALCMRLDRGCQHPLSSVHCEGRLWEWAHEMLQQLHHALVRDSCKLLRLLIIMERGCHLLHICSNLSCCKLKLLSSWSVGHFKMEFAFTRVCT